MYILLRPDVLSALIVVNMAISDLVSFDYTILLTIVQYLYKLPQHHLFLLLSLNIVQCVERSVLADPKFDSRTP